MKALKVLFYTFLFLMLIVIVAGTIFIFRFDINQYKDPIAQTISEKIGYPIKLGSLAIGFKHGFSIEALSLSVEGEPKSGKGFFSLNTEELSFKVDPEMLLKRELLVSKIYLKSPKLIYQVTAQNSLSLIHI